MSARRNVLLLWLSGNCTLSPANCTVQVRNDTLLYELKVQTTLFIHSFHRRQGCSSGNSIRQHLQRCKINTRLNEGTTHIFNQATTGCSLEFIVDVIDQSEQNTENKDINRDDIQI